MSVPPFPDAVEGAYEEGLACLERGAHFDAHEAFETAWRAAARSDRDFFQGLVHVAVAWYQAERRNRVGCERQLEKAQRRLGPYAPSYRGLDVSGLLVQLRAAFARSPDLPPLVLTRGRRTRAPG